MADENGRDFVIQKAGTTLAGLRTNDAAIDNSPINITDKDDNGFRTLGEFSGERTLDISASGIVKDATMRAVAYGADTGLMLTDITINWLDSGDSVTGDFFLASMTESGARDGETTFDLSLQSSGAWVYAAGTP